ncbi:MAG: 4a-hydroxytetrahydrobiopterin dehydratase [Planctomycetota bacterium]|jgi:4a-hydroxytetrahydrobiopterin dehydratase
MSEENSLAKSKCTPCQGGVEPLDREEIEKLLQKLSPGWQVILDRHLEKEYKFKNFIQALEFVNKVGQMAESQGHHPDIYLSWGKVKLKIWTHKIDGLHKNDFILAAGADELFE